MAKRANNEGTLYFREDRKRWCAQVCLDGRRLTKYARTQAECRDWIKETIKKIICMKWPWLSRPVNANS